MYFLLFYHSLQAAALPLRLTATMAPATTADGKQQEDGALCDDDLVDALGAITHRSVDGK
jgi:hypothetical protein